MKNWRAVALTIVLGGLVVAGGFMLPGNEPGDPGLMAAARRTLAEPGFRTTVHGFGAPTVEDYHAPDQVRIVTDFQGQRSQVIVLGSVTYTEFECQSPTASSHTFIRHEGRRSDETGSRRAPVSTSGRTFLALAFEGGDTASTQAGPSTNYTVVFPGRPHPSPSLVPLRARFVVARGLVRQASIVVAEHLGKQHAVQTIDLGFSRFGRVPAIGPPPAAEVSPQQGFVCDLTGSTPPSPSRANAT